MEDILSYLNNYFYKFGERNTYTIKDGKITVKGVYYVGQYIRIEGSIMNNGVYKVENVEGNILTLTGTTDDVFKGYVYSLAIPKNLITLSATIEKFKEENKPSIYLGESFGNYSYSRATVNGDLADWTHAFKSNLKPYRKMKDSKVGVNLI